MNEKRWLTLYTVVAMSNVLCGIILIIIHYYVSNCIRVQLIIKVGQLYDNKIIIIVMA